MPRRVEFTKAGAPNTIRVSEMPMPEPKAGEVRIKVAFAGINFADLLMRLGFYQPRPPYPFTPGYEVSGIIIGMGGDVENLKIGDRVIAMTGFDDLFAKSGIILGPFPDHVRINSGSFWDELGITSRSFWDHSTVSLCYLGSSAKSVAAPFPRTENHFVL